MSDEQYQGGLAERIKGEGAQTGWGESRPGVGRGEGGTENEHMTAAGLSKIAAKLYRDEPLVLRSMQKYRPFISPFELLLPLVKPGSTVLDVGCGGGLFLALLAAQGRVAHAVGFDSSKPAIIAAQGAKRALAERGGVLTFVELDAAAPWPAEPAKFDVVSIIDVVHHVDRAHQQSVVETACQRVRAGGILIYKDMCERPWWRATANRCHDLVMARQWIRTVPIEMVERWAEGAGMRTIQRTDVSRFWYGHELRVFEKTSA